MNDIKDVLRASSSGDQGDCTTESHRNPTIEVHNKKGRESKQINLRSRTKQEESPKMGRKRNKPQLKGKKEAPERVLDETEASKLSDIEFKTMVIRKLNDFSENYREL